MLNIPERAITTLFHTMYYYSAHTWNMGNTTWRGIPMLQNPLDMFVIQEIITETNPDLIVETGTARGASALFYCDVSDRVRVISIDTQERHEPLPELRKHPRITFIKGMSTDPKIVARVKKEAKGKKCMVILDSDHSTENVYAEMQAYHPIVTRGCYMIVEDTNLGNNPVAHFECPGDGPKKAVEMFLEKNKNFAIDLNREKYYMTFHPGGWLKRI